MDHDKFKSKIDEILTIEHVKSIISGILDCKVQDNDSFIGILSH